MNQSNFELPELLRRYLTDEARRLGVSESAVVTFAVGLLAVERQLLREGALGMLVHPDHRTQTATGALCLLGTLEGPEELVNGLTPCTDHLVVVPGEFGIPPLRLV
jgi:hypothetical protein